MHLNVRFQIMCRRPRLRSECLFSALSVQTARPLCPAVSTIGRNTGLKFLSWCLILYGPSRPLVELACDSAEFGLANSGYISAFGEVLSEKAVGIFIAPALPCTARQAMRASPRGRLRITKIDIDIRGYGELSMPRHF